jgi:hypothetical protein
VLTGPVFITKDNVAAVAEYAQYTGYTRYAATGTR